MKLDVRLPMGALFTIIGAILCVYGAVGGAAALKKGCPLNINLWWGLAMLLFGAALLAIHMAKGKAKV